MRGSQSDPTHTHAPVCPCLGACYARVNAGGRGQARARLPRCHCQGLARRGCCDRATRDRCKWRGYNKRFNGLVAAFGAGLYAGLGAGFWRACGAFWGPCWAFAYGLQCAACWARADDAYFHCAKPQHCAGIQHGMVYGIAYGLGYGIALAWLALSVWLRRAGGLLAVNI